MLGERVSSAAVEDAGFLEERLEELLPEVYAAGDSREAAGRLNAAFRSLRPPVHPSDATRLLEYLGDPRSRGHLDVDGTLCRAEAVAALLRLGYPHALQITPEDLAWFRALPRPARRARGRRLAGVAAAVLALAVGVGSFAFSGTGSRLLPPAVEAVRPAGLPSRLVVGSTTVTARLVGLSYPSLVLTGGRATWFGWREEAPLQVVLLELQDETGRVVQRWVRPKALTQRSPLSEVVRYPLELKVSPRPWKLVAHVSVDGAPPVPLAVVDERPAPRAVR